MTLAELGQYPWTHIVLAFAGGVCTAFLLCWARRFTAQYKTEGPPCAPLTEAMTVFVDSQSERPDTIGMSGVALVQYRAELRVFNDNIMSLYEPMAPLCYDGIPIDRVDGSGFVCEFRRAGKIVGFVDSIEANGGW